MNPLKRYDKKRTVQYNNDQWLVWFLIRITTCRLVLKGPGFVFSSLFDNCADIAAILSNYLGHSYSECAIYIAVKRSTLRGILGFDLLVTPIPSYSPRTHSPGTYKRPSPFSFDPVLSGPRFELRGRDQNRTTCKATLS